MPPPTRRPSAGVPVPVVEVTAVGDARPVHRCADPRLPGLGSRLAAVPDPARADGDREVVPLGRQMAAAYRWLRRHRARYRVDLLPLHPVPQCLAAADVGVRRESSQERAPDAKTCDTAGLRVRHALRRRRLYRRVLAR